MKSDEKENKRKSSHLDNLGDGPAAGQVAEDGEHHDTREDRGQRVAEADNEGIPGNKFLLCVFPNI